MLVRNVMTPRAETVGPDETLECAARMMGERGVGALVVVEGRELVGILTDRDIVVRSVARGREPSQADVRSAMTPQLLGCRADDRLEDAVRRMEEGSVRRLAVLDDGDHLVGMLSVDDIALHSAPLAGEIIEHAREPERSIHTGAWDWWEEPSAAPR